MSRGWNGFTRIARGVFSKKKEKGGGGWWDGSRTSPGYGQWEMEMVVGRLDKLGLLGLGDLGLAL